MSWNKKAYTLAKKICFRKKEVEDRAIVLSDKSRRVITLIMSRKNTMKNLPQISNGKLLAKNPESKNNPLIRLLKSKRINKIYLVKELKRKKVKFQRRKMTVKVKVKEDFTQRK